MIRRLLCIVVLVLMVSTAAAQIIGSGMLGGRRYRALQFDVGEDKVELTGEEGLALSGENAITLDVSINATKGPYDPH